MESETDSAPRVVDARTSLNDCDHESWEIGLSGMPLRCSDCGHVFTTEESIDRCGADSEHKERARRAVRADAATPTGGGLTGVDYYFTINVGTSESPIFQTCVRRLVIPRDAVVTCQGNTLVIEHPGVADTFRIGRVVPVESA